MIQLFKDKKYWREMAIILLFGIAINIACFYMPLIVHAENSVRHLPYDYTWNYYPLSQDNIDMMLNHASPYVDITSDNLIIFWSEIGDNMWLYTYCVAIVDDVTLAQGFSYDTIDLTQQTVYFHFSDSYIGQTQLTSNGLWLDADQNYSPSGYTFFGTNATIVHPVDYPYDYTFRNMPLYGNVTLDGKTYVGSNNINIGDFTDLPPIDEILNNISENYTPHTNNPPPTYDNNISDGENISNAITGHSNNMNNAINNLGENIKNFFNKLYEKLTNVGNKISQNIYNGFSTLMQNIKEFFGPKLDSINDKLGQLVDHISQDDEESQQEIESALQGTTFYQDFDDMKGLVTDSVAIWNSTSAPSEYKIPFHVERIDILNCDECQYIDLSLYSSVFPYLRGVMWALTTYSLVYTIIDSIASYISGGDE